MIEVVIATMIAALTTVAVFSVTLTSVVSQKKADRKENAAMVLRQAQQTLKTYVTVDPSDVLHSPNAGGTWLDGTWALSGGVHDITSLMPPDLCATGACSFTYTVTNIDCGFGTGKNSCKSVKFDMTYPD